ncbi:MAG: hypothetical protein ACKOEY_14970 [Phenylobacterium sp.]
MNIVILLGVVVTLATGLPVLRQLLREHPRGLLVLFFAEMWERFSYYGMRGILIFYLTQHLLFDSDEASALYASYTALVYLLPLLGGFIADRWLGSRKAVAFGALLLVAGHIAMGFEGRPSQQDLIYGGNVYPIVAEGRMDDRQAYVLVDGTRYEFGPREGGGIEIPGVPIASGLPSSIPEGDYEVRTLINNGSASMFYFAVSLIILGVGFLKPNISSVVGELYPHGDPRRDSGFTLFEQAGSSLNLFASTNVDLSLTHEAGRFLGIPYGTPEQLAAIGVEPAGWWAWIDTSMGAAQTQSFNAGFILILAPVLAAVWTWLGKRGRDP